MAEDVLMDMVDEEDGLLINRMQLHGPANDASRALSSSLPDTSLATSERGPVVNSHSLPRMSGSMQTLALRHQVSRHQKIQHAGAINAQRTPHPPHRERLVTTVVNTHIFGDNRQAVRARNRNLALQGPDFGVFMLPEDDGFHYEIRIPFAEPFLYAVWVTPLNLVTCKILRQIPLFVDENLVKQTLISLTSSTFILCLIMDPLPAIHFMEFFRSNTFTTYFYNHHVSAIEGLVISKVVDVVLDYQNVSPEVRLASLLGTFFLGFIFRHTVRRMRTTSRTLSLGENFLMIMIY